MWRAIKRLFRRRPVPTAYSFDFTLEWFTVDDECPSPPMQMERW